MEKGLCEICNPKQWKTISSDMLTENGYPVYGANGIIGYYENYNHKETTILITCRGATCGTLNICKPFSYVNGNAMALDNLSEEIYIQYLYYYLLSRGLSDVITGSAQPQIVRQSLEKVKVKYPSLEKQRKIAAVLDKVSDLIAKRRQQLDKLDLLIKSKFVEMFGDPILNNKGWLIKKIIEECDCMVPGRDKPKSFTGDIPWITIDDLCLNGITYKSKQNLGLTQKEIDSVNRKAIPKDSVIMSCVGNLGICSIAGTDMVINQQLHSFQCRSRLNNIYLMFYLGQRKDYMNQQATSTTVLYMNKSVCNSIPTMVPPIELQNQFAAFVEQTENTKTTISRSLEKLETLKKALMQEYFG